MKQDIKKQDFWEYVARIQEEVGQEVLEQVTDEEYFPCVRAINITDNKFIKLINEALKKRNIFIASNYIHISIG